MRWWIRPLVRAIAAIVLPLLVPLLITGVLWGLPGDPVATLCPDCADPSYQSEQWNLHRGPWFFYWTFVSNAVLHFDLGKSWVVYQGMAVTSLLAEFIPWTTLIILCAMASLVVGSALSALGYAPRWTDPVLQGFGLVPAVILALACAAVVEITFGPNDERIGVRVLRLVLAAIVLGVADNALAGAVVGTRSVFESEEKQRYSRIAILRGETVLSNTLPNVLPALVGQFRGRVLHLISGAVVVEVVMGIPGLGSLLWDGTLAQDFGLVLAGTWVFVLISSALLLLQAALEVVIALHVRRAPPVPS